MDENTINSVEENTTDTTTENIDTSSDTLVEDKSSTTNPLLLDDNIALAYDYYDSYYNNILNKLDTIITEEETINTNLEDIKSQNDTLIFGSNIVIFVLVLSFIYTYLRNMIIVK